jgi:hypothetical protein
VLSCPMDRVRLERHLLQAERHVLEGEGHVARVRAVIAERQRQRLDAREATDLLRQFEEAQATHIAHRDRLRKELGL